MVMTMGLMSLCKIGRGICKLLYVDSDVRRGKDNVEVKVLIRAIFDLTRHILHVFASDEELLYPHNTKAWTLLSILIVCFHYGKSRTFTTN